MPAARLGDVRAMGDEGQHSRFTLWSGGARARGVAFRTAPRALTGAAGDEPCDAAVRLELNRWNGVVEARVELSALCEREAADCPALGEDEPFWERVERESAAGDDGSVALGGQPRRELRDRRGEGFAGVAGDLLSSGEGVLVVCAEVSRRRQGLGRVLGGLGNVAAVSWSALASRPGLAEPFQHLVALDPSAHAGLGAPLRAAARGLRAPRLGEPEIAFALAHEQAELDLRPALVELYRALREAGGAPSGDEVEALLVGRGAHPRPPALCARLIAVLDELGLASFDARRCTLIEAGRVELERSATYVRCQERLAAVRRHLAAPVALPAAAA